MNSLRIATYLACLLFALAPLTACTDGVADDGNDNVRAGDNQNPGDNDGELDAGDDADEADTDDGSDGGESDGGEADGGEPDGGESDGGEPDGGDPPGSSCEDIADTSATFELPGQEAAYYGKLAFADDTLWALYVTFADVGGGEEEEKVHLVRIGCDGAIIDDAEAIGSDDDVREFHPAIAVGEEAVYVVWVAEEAEGQKVYGRTFDFDGTPNQPAPFVIEPSLKNGEVVGTIWKPDLGITRAGDAVLVVEGLTTMDPRVIMQRFDADGELVGDGFFVFDSDDHGGQTDPTVALADDGSIQFAYLGGDINDGRVYHGVVEEGEDEPSGQPVAAHPTDTTNVSVDLSEPTAGGFTWLAYPVGFEASNQISLRDATVAGPTDTESTGVSGRVNLHTEVAASDTGGAVAWMSYASSPTQLRVHFQRFEADSGAAITGLGTRVDQHNQDDASWPYEPSIVWLYDDVYAAVWTEGPSGDLSVQGRILELQ